MRHRDIIVIGASAGGVETLQRLVHALPATVAASIFVTVHFPEHGTSTLPRILSRAGALPVLHPTDGESIVPGRIYVAPPNYHLLVEQKGIHLSHGPRENGNRPAIDPMFRSAAIAFGRRVIGVLLSGNLDDGTSGLAAIKRRGGLAVVQDPNDALFPSMVLSAMENVATDCIVPVKSMARTLTELVAEPLPPEDPLVMQDDAIENELSSTNLDAIEDPDRHPGHVSAFSCPDCGGVLWEIRDGDFARFRCRVGHAWTAEALFAKQTDVFDDALWTALRALEESASMAHHLAARHRKRGNASLAERFDRQAQSIEARAAVIRDALARGDPVAPVDRKEDPAHEPAGERGVRQPDAT